MPTPGAQNLSQHPAGMPTANRYSAEPPIRRSAVVDFAPGAGGHDGQGYDGNTGPRMKAAFSNPWSPQKTEMVKPAGLVGRFQEGHGNGRFAPHTPPQAAAGTYPLPPPPYA
jgi:hypothetical protein